MSELLTPCPSTAAGFYGITVAETDGSPSYSGINKVNFNSSDFYVTQNSPNTDEVIVNFKGSPAGTGEANTASNLGAGEGIFAQKVGVDLQFKSLTAGSNITLTSSSTEINIAATGSGPGFYGIIVEESDQTNTLRDDTIRFLAADFDVSNVNNKPQVALATNIARLSDIGPGFYGIIVKESDDSIVLRDDTISFFATDFDVSNVNNKPQVALATNIARISDIGPGFYGIIVEESDLTNTQRDDTIRFLAGDFDVSNINNKPQVALATNVARLSDIGPGFYGITVKETDGSPAYKSINVVSFDSNDFYVNQNSTNTDEVIVSWRGDKTTASNLGAGTGIFAQEVTDDLQFKSLVAGSGISLSNDANTITVAATGSSAATEGFYGITVAQTDGFGTFRNINKVNFESQWFYINQNSPNIDEAVVNFRGVPPAGETNTASNIGAGTGVFAQKVGVDLQFKSFLAGTNVTISSDADEITINSSGGTTPGNGTRQSFTNAVEVQVPHNFNTDAVIWSIFNSKGRAFIPDVVDVSNPNIAFFYLLTPVTGHVVIAPGTVPPATFYGITIRETDNAPAYKNINVISFNSTNFYLTQDPSNTDEATVNFRGPVRWTVLGGISAVGGNATSIASYGNNVAIGDPVMAFAGQVTAVSLSLSAARTNGSVIAFVAKNGVNQNGAGQVVQINTAIQPQFKHQIITPISYAPGDRIGLRTTTVGFTPTGSDATVTAFFEENV